MSQLAEKIILRKTSIGNGNRNTSRNEDKNWISSYEEFEKRLLEIYSISKESYFSKMDKKPDYVMRFNKNNSTINLIREKLLQLGVNQN